MIRTGKIKFVWTAGLLGALALGAPAVAADRARPEAERMQSGQSDAARYSDRDRMSAWEKGKKDLQQALKPGQERDFYRKELEKRGFLITSVNQDKPDYIEYEVVKGDQSYEVQVDLNEATHKAKKVEIGVNMWQAEGTERALESGSGGRTDIQPRSQAR